MKEKKKNKKNYKKIILYDALTIKMINVFQ